MKIETINDLENLRPCSEGLKYAKSFPTLSEAWESCERSDWMLWLLKKKGSLTKPEVILLACDFAEHVLPFFESRFPTDMRPRAAVEAARRCLSVPTRENISSAYIAHVAAAAADAATAADAAAADAATAAADAVATAAYSADASYSAACAAAAYSYGYSAAERKWQAQKIRELVPNPFEN